MNLIERQQENKVQQDKRGDININMSLGRNNLVKEKSHQIYRQCLSSHQKITSPHSARSREEVVDAHNPRGLGLTLALNLSTLSHFKVLVSNEYNPLKRHSQTHSKVERASLPVSPLNINMFSPETPLANPLLGQGFSSDVCICYQLKNKEEYHILSRAFPKLWLPIEVKY